MQSVAKDKNIIFGIRPVESMVRQLVEEGYPSKGFLVKGKSANWGPQAGFICEKQQLSKKEGSEQNVINKLNNDVQSGKNKAYLVSDLKLSYKRIKELTFNLHLITIGINDELIPIESRAPSGDLYEFEARREEDGLYTIYEKNEKNEKEPIQVLSHLRLNKPLTADYDLFFISPRIEEHAQSGLDTQPNTAIVYGKSLSREDSIEEFFANEDKVMGNISPRGRGLVSELNIKLNRGDDLEMFHHNDDAGSPVSDIKDNFPATFFLPKPLEVDSSSNQKVFEKISIIKDRSEFSVFIKCIKDNGYHFTSNPNWKDVPRRTSFEHAKNYFLNPK